MVNFTKNSKSWQVSLKKKLMYPVCKGNDVAMPSAWGHTTLFDNTIFRQCLQTKPTFICLGFEILCAVYAIAFCAPKLASTLNCQSVIPQFLDINPWFRHLTMSVVCYNEINSLYNNALSIVLMST